MVTLRPLREKLVRIGAKVVRSARYVTFQLAEKVLHWLRQTHHGGFGGCPPWQMGNVG